MKAIGIYKSLPVEDPDCGWKWRFPHLNRQEEICLFG